MKFIVLLFGAGGFTLVMIAGFMADRQTDLVLRDAALACLVSALVARWFSWVLDRSFVQTVRARREAAEKIAAEKNKPVTPPAARPSSPPLPAPARSR